MDDLIDVQSSLEGLIGDDGEFRAPDPIEPDKETAEQAPAKEPVAEVKPAAQVAESPEAKQAADEPRYRVKIDGEEREIPVSELVKGFQLQSDYTRKTQQVAEERRGLETEKEKLVREREEFVQSASTEMTLLQRQIDSDAKVDWQALLNSDPVEYMRQKEAAEGRRQQYFQLRHQQGQVVEALQQEQQERHSAYVAEQAGILEKELPDLFGDEAKSAETKKQLREFMAGQGFDSAEIATVASARDVKLLINAMRYDQLQKAKVEDTKRVKPAPAKVEPASAQVDDGGSRLNKSAMDRLKKSGGRDTSAAQRAIESLLD